MRIALIAGLLWLLPTLTGHISTPASQQIQVGGGDGRIAAESSYAPFEPIVLEVEQAAAPGQKIHASWRVDKPAAWIQAGPTTVHIWAPPQATPYEVSTMVLVTQSVTIPQPDGTTIEGDLLIGPPRDYSTQFTVTGPQPGPGPGPPPGPGPDPGPDPDPDPEPEPDGEFGPSPFTGEGLRVLVIYEYDNLASYPVPQFDQLGSLTLRKWMTDNAAKDEQGHVEYRCVDQHAVSIPSKWKDALSRNRQSLPWMIAGNGHKGYEGPLPETEEETIALLERLQRAR